MSKNLVYSEEARQVLLKGINTVANAVKITMGPKGRNVILSKNGTPQIVNDGITIAREIDLKDPLEDLGAQLAKDTSAKTNDQCGDGSSQSILLVQALAQRGLRNISSGANPVEVRKGIQQATDFVVNEIKEVSREVSSSEDIFQVGMISAGNNEEIGHFIAEGMEKVGKDGIITISESKSSETNLKVVEGMEFDRGYISPYFVTDSEKMEAVLIEPFVLCVNKKIASIADIVPVLEQVARSGQPLFIIAEDVEGEALSTLVVNTMRKVLKAVAVKAPDFGEGRKNKLYDISVLTGGVLVDDATGETLDKLTIEDLGKAKQVTVTKDTTTIVVEERSERLNAHVNTLRAQVENADTDYEKDKIKERLAKLAGGVAMIEVGASTELEMKDKKLRIEDALNATKAAVKEGIVPGGGVTLAKISKKLRREIHKRTLSDDVRFGYQIVVDALTAPLYQIAENAGVDGAVVVDKVVSSKDPNFGYDALTGKYVDMFKAGIVDPTKVIRCAIQNASSVASLLLTTEVAVVDNIEENTKPNPAIMGM